MKMKGAVAKTAPADKKQYAKNAYCFFETATD